MSAEVSAGMAVSVEQTLTVSTTESFEVTCEGSAHQWIVEAEHTYEPFESGTTYVQSDIHVCVGFNEAPLCPYGSCLDDNCLQCDDWTADVNATDIATSYILGSCNFATRRFDGVHDDDDFAFVCSDGYLLSMFACEDGEFGGVCDNTWRRRLDEEAGNVPDAADGRKLSEGDGPAGYGGNACLACNWEGVRYYRGADTCDDFMLECYSGFLYGITFVGNEADFSDADCVGAYLVAPARDVLYGTQCNWEYIDMTMNNLHDDQQLKITCTDGYVTKYTFLA